MLNIQKIKTAAVKTSNSLKQALPVLLGMILLIGLMTVFIPKNFYNRVFTNNTILDPLIGAVFGSIVAGNPLTSYIIGGELNAQGVGMIAITAFILSWVTVGLIQLPAESLMLGKKFAVTRNIVSFFMAIIISILTVMTLGVLK